MGILIDNLLPCRRHTYHTIGVPSRTMKDNQLHFQHTFPRNVLKNFREEFRAPKTVAHQKASSVARRAEPNKVSHMSLAWRLFVSRTFFVVITPRVVGRD